MLYRTLLVSILAANIMAIALSFVARSPLNFALGPALLLFVWMWLTFETAHHERINGAMKAAKQQNIEIVMGFWLCEICAVTVDGVTNPRLRLKRTTSTQPGTSKQIEKVTLEVRDATRLICTPEWLVDYARTMNPTA